VVDGLPGREVVWQQSPQRAAADYIAVDVRLAGGQCRLFWPRDLEEISPLRLGGACLRWGRWNVIRAFIHPSAQKVCSRKVGLRRLPLALDLVVLSPRLPRWEVEEHDGAQGR
jgi:hypothetical protein